MELFQFPLVLIVLINCTNLGSLYLLHRRRVALLSRPRLYDQTVTFYYMRMIVFLRSRTSPCSFLVYCALTCLKAFLLTSRIKPTCAPKISHAHQDFLAYLIPLMPLPAHNPLIVVTVKSPLIHIPLFFRLIPSPISPQIAEEFQTRPDQTAKPRNKTTITDRQRSRFPPL